MHDNTASPKYPYTGTMESFKKVILTAQGTPVVSAGGPLIDEETAIKNVQAAFLAGAAGISFARNVFGRESPLDFINKVRKSLHR